MHQVYLLSDVRSSASLWLDSIKGHQLCGSHRIVRMWFCGWVELRSSIAESIPQDSLKHRVLVVLVGIVGKETKYTLS
jgi:hypothetical protein